MRSKSLARAPRRARRRLALESLESRRVLAAGPPGVAEVAVAATAWESDFLDALETAGLGSGGYALPAGAGQTQALPWNNIDQLRITFSEDVQIDAADLSLSGVNVTAYELADFAYDSQDFTATWTLAAPLEADKLWIDLAGDGLDPVQDVEGNVLDGEWTNSADTFPSGDGTAGGDFEFRLDALPADANRSGLVTNFDYFLILISQGKSAGDPGYDPFRDLDGSGVIDAGDKLFIQQHLFDNLPLGDPTGAGNDAPSTAGLDGVSVDEDAVDAVIALWDAFADAEQPASNLTYEVVDNSDPSLLDNVSIDPATGELSLDFAADAAGDAELVVRATDSAGLFVETPLSVQVAAVNDAPVITDFLGELVHGNDYLFTGTVTDVDGDPTGWTVTFGGVLEGHTATVQADGTFALAVQLDPSVWGDAFAQTTDDEGLDSNLAVFFVASK